MSYFLMLVTSFFTVHLSHLAEGLWQGSPSGRAQSAPYCDFLAYNGR